MTKILTWLFRLVDHEKRKKINKQKTIINNWK